MAASAHCAWHRVVSDLGRFAVLAAVATIPRGVSRSTSGGLFRSALCRSFDKVSLHENGTSRSPITPPHLGSWPNSGDGRSALIPVWLEQLLDGCCPPYGHFLRRIRERS